jgi:hypothetical protein
LLQGFQQEAGNKTILRKNLEKPVFFELLNERSFYNVPDFLHFIDTKGYDETTCDSKRLYQLRTLKESY